MPHVEFATLEALRDFVSREICNLGNLLHGAFDMTQQLLRRQGKPCGYYFCLQGPRQVQFVAIWEKGDDFTGDPPHEHQGWYSVYNVDESTLDIISTFTLKMASLNHDK